MRHDDCSRVSAPVFLLAVVAALSACGAPQQRPGLVPSPAAGTPLPVSAGAPLRSDTLSATGPCVTGGPFRSSRLGPIFEEPEQSASPLSQGFAPRYPAQLQRERKQGSVLATYIIDEQGEVEIMSAQIVESPHPHFSISVCRFLSVARFTPAVHQGAKVRHQVQQAFVFELQ